MLQEEESEGSSVEEVEEEEVQHRVGGSKVRPGTVWPPPGLAITRPAGFMGKISAGKGPGGRPVEWPPRFDQDQINNAPNMTTVYPSSFKLRETPNENAPAKVVTSQPIFQTVRPTKKLGDDNWPPKGFGESGQNEVREVIRPQKMSKNYAAFYEKNALPHNYSGYRAPPGTQHKDPGEEEEEEEEDEEEEDEE